MQSPGRLRILLVAGTLLCAVGGLPAGIPEKIEDAVEDFAEETWYLRTNVPYLDARNGFGPAPRALVVVEPASGIRILTGRLAATGGADPAHRMSLRVNDPVEIEDFEWDSEDASLTLRLEGEGRAEDGRGVIRLAGIHSLKDLEACWNTAFSERRLDKVPGWSPDIRKAVARREVLAGMTREQVLVAVGTPERIARFGEPGDGTETWVVRSIVPGGDTGPEVEIRFVAGKVTQVGPAVAVRSASGDR